MLPGIQGMMSLVSCTWRRGCDLTGQEQPVLMQRQTQHLRGPFDQKLEEAIHPPA